MTNAASQEATSQEKNISSSISQFKYSQLVVMADVTKTKHSGLQIFIKKVLKGDRLLNYKVINIPQCVKRRKDHFLHYFNSNITKNSIILFSKNWLNKPCDPIYNVFNDDRTNDKVKAVLTHQSIVNERKRLKLLLKLIPTDTYKIKRLVFDQFKAMTNPKNFYLFNTLIDKSTKCQNKKSALDLMIRTYDFRAVPYLIDLLSEETCDINQHAAKALSYEFAGAKGVTAALSKQVNNPDISFTAKKYLSQRYPNPSYKPLPRDEYPLFLGTQSLKKGDVDGALNYFLSNLDTNAESTPCASKYGAAFSSIKAALPYVREKHLDRIYTYLASIDFTDSAFDFFQKRIAAQVYYDHPRPGNLTKLLSLLQVSTEEYQAFRQLLLLLKKKDKETRTQASHILEQKIEENNKRQWNLIQGIYWLGNDAFISETLQNHSKKGQRKLRESQYQALKSLKAIQGGFNDYAFFKTAVSTPEVTADRLLISMIIKSLTEFNHPETPQLLTQMLNKNFKTTETSVREAFIAINTEEIHQIVIKLMNSDDKSLRKFATQTLYELQPESILNHMRKALTNPIYGDQAEAAYRLGLIGEVHDIGLLSPVCNYWTQNRKSSQRACISINRLRSKYKHDINGPIIQSPNKNPNDNN